MKKNIEGLLMGLGIFLFVAIFPPAVNASPLGVLLETDIDSEPNNELIVAEFDSMAQLISHTTGGQTLPTTWNMNSLYSSTGITYDGDKYHVLYEADDDMDISSAELAVATFDSIGDLITGNSSCWAPISWNMSPSYSSTGLTYDGNKYHVLLETNDANGYSSGLGVVAFNSIDDLVNMNTNQWAPVSWDMGFTYSSTGFTYDGDSGKYHVLLESNVDYDISSDELLVYTFNSILDLIGFGNYQMASVNWNMSAPYSSTGLYSNWSDSSNPILGMVEPEWFITPIPGSFYNESVVLSPTPTPEPATFFLFFLGLLGLAGISRRKK